MNNQRYIVMAFLGLAALVGMTVTGIGEPVLARLDVGNPQLAGLIDATSFVGIISGVVTFLILMRHRVVLGYTDEVVTELRKVVWPDKDDTVRSSMIVLGVTFVIAGSLAFYDYVWARLTSAFLFTEG